MTIAVGAKDQGIEILKGNSEFRVRERYVKLSSNTLFTKIYLL
jgi:hypothetical protein